MKKCSKGDFWKKNFGFTLKTVPGIHDPHISWLPFGTKNHKMHGPPMITPLFFLFFSIKLQRFKRGGEMEDSSDPRGIQENVANSERRPGWI